MDFQLVNIKKICSVNETDNPDELCDDCKFSMMSNDGGEPRI